MLADTRWRWCVLAATLCALSGCVEGGAIGDASTGDAGEPIGPIVWCPALATCDDGDPCTDFDACDEGLCVGTPRVCESPPGQCYVDVGACAEGDCAYTAREGGCDDGDACTVRDRCSGGACAGSPIDCQAPPAPRCLGDGQLRVFVESGRCAAGECVYTPVDTPCPGGACLGGACECTPLGPTSTVVDTGLFGPEEAPIEPSLLVEDAGAMHVGYHDPAHGALRVAHRHPSGTWSHELVDATSGAGLGSALFAEGEDLYVVYERPSSVWWARRGVGSLAWELSAIGPSGGRANPALFVESDGAAHVAYTRTTGNGERHLAYSRRAAGVWSRELLDSSGDTGVEPTVWMDPIGLQLIYRDAAVSAMRAMGKSGDPWQSASAPVSVATRHVAAVDHDGGAHVVFGEPGGSWRYARRDRAGAPWIEEALPPGFDAVGELALWAAPGGELHMSYRRDLPGAAYGYARRSRLGGWTTTALVSFEAGGGGTAVGVDASGRAHVALLDGSTGELRVISLRVCE